MAHKEWYQLPQSQSSCPTPMTRAALVALRDAGTLTTGCHYTVTDHVQGRLVAGTTVTLHAAAANELADTALVNTTYDNEAWSGRYDADTGLVYELTDNRNNRVLGAGAVAAFDWGNTAYTDCTVEHSTWNVTIGNTQVMSRVRVLDGSVLNTTGIAGGGLQNVTIGPISAVNLTNANLLIRDTSFRNGASLNAAGYVAGGAGIYRSDFSDGSAVTFGPGSGTVSFQYTTIADSAIVNHTGTGALSINNSALTNSAVITHSSAAQATITSSAVQGVASVVTHTDNGQLTMSGVNVTSGAGVYKNGTSTGSMQLTYCDLAAGAFVRQLGNGNIVASGTALRARANIQSVAGSNVPVLTVQDCELSNSASISMNPAATAGNASITATSLRSGGTITKAGTGQLTISNTEVTSTGRIELTGVRNLSIDRCEVSNYGRILSSSAVGAGVGDSVLYSTCADYGAITLSASGAASNSVQYSGVHGVSGAINIQGTNTGATMSRAIADNGTITLDSNTVAMPTVFNLSARDGGAITVAGCTAAQDIRNNSVDSGGVLSISNKSVASQVWNNNVSCLGTLTTQGPAVHCRQMNVMHGAVNHNGGTILASSKSSGGTLTTGAFNHTGIQHHTNANKTLTANNTSRADYQGLAAQLV